MDSPCRRNRLAAEELPRTCTLFAAMVVACARDGVAHLDLHRERGGGDDVDGVDLELCDSDGGERPEPAGEVCEEERRRAADGGSEATLPDLNAGAITEDRLVGGR